MKGVRGNYFSGDLMFLIAQRAVMMARWALVALAAH
jgi:hypothetical protein